MTHNQAAIPPPPPAPPPAALAAVGAPPTTTLDLSTGVAAPELVAMELRRQEVDQIASFRTAAGAGYHAVASPTVFYTPR